MKNIIFETTLESSEKRFSNYSVRRTLVTKMKKANLERLSIAKVTGHRNIQSLDDYKEADEHKQRQLACKQAHIWEHTRERQIKSESDPTGGVW